MTAQVTVNADAPQHLVDQAYRNAQVVADKFGVTDITVHKDHVAYHNMLPIAKLDVDVAKHGPKYAKGGSPMVDTTKVLSWDQVVKPKGHQKRK